ncbi:MAG: hypothetical protein HY543_11260 [Deltaproteobacteria bacterium]|nr:hypothetical protein [Deltaproteobacteria bacterium]
MATRDTPRKVIPDHMIPPVASEIVEHEGGKFLQTNEAMFTFYKRTKGEFSKYFLGLRDEKKIWGIKCPKCRAVRVPPFELLCPDCDFCDMEWVVMGDTGVMNSTPPITYFAHSLFQSWVPFGRGRVVLDGAETALPIHVFTTKGVLTPFIFKKGMPVKVVFRNERMGKPTDIFAVPMHELTPAQRKQSPLMESDLDCSTPVEPNVGAPTEAAKTALAKAYALLQQLASGVERSPRAQHNLAGWSRRIAVRTNGGDFGLVIDQGRLTVGTAPAADRTDLVMVAGDPQLFVEWLTFKEALTNAIIAGTLWISKNREFTTVFKLDRLPRSVHRDTK